MKSVVAIVERVLNGAMPVVVVVVVVVAVVVVVFALRITHALHPVPRPVPFIPM